MLGTEDVYNAAAILLHYVDEAAISLGVRLPARRTVTSGGAVYDCEMVTVSPSLVVLGAPSNQDGRLVPCGPSMWAFTGDLAIVRKAAEHMTGARGTTPPSPAMLFKDSAQVSADAAVIVEAVNRYADVTRDASLSIAIGSPLGGLIATVGSITVPLWPTDVHINLPKGYVCPPL